MANLTKNYKKDFSSKGYAIFRNWFDKDKLNLFYRDVLNISYFYLLKIKSKKNKLNKIYNSNKSFYEKYCLIHDLYEKDHKDVLHQTQKLIEQNLQIQNLFNDNKTINIFKNFLNIHKDQPIFFHGPNVFVNRPRVKRLLYKWHHESSFYPKRQNFLNVWIPIFKNKTSNNGTMKVKVSSHKLKEIPINEYIGYDTKTLNGKNSFFQKEIPARYIKRFKTKSMDLNVGDMVVFDKKLAHSSSINKSKSYTFALVLRVWEFSKDFTFSHDFGVTHNRYSRDEVDGHPEIDIS